MIKNEALMDGQWEGLQFCIGIGFTTGYHIRGFLSQQYDMFIHNDGCSSRSDAALGYFI